MSHNLFLYIWHYFLLKIRHFDYYVATLKISFCSCSRVCWCYFLWVIVVYLFSDFPNSFYKVYIIVIYGHRNLCSVSLVVSCFKISWRQEGSKEGKEKKILSHSLHIRSLLGHSSTFGQAIYNSSLVFTSCLFRAWRPTRGKSLGSSRAFLSMHPVLGMYMAFFPPILWYVCQI